MGARSRLSDRARQARYCQGSIRPAVRRISNNPEQHQDDSGLPSANERILHEQPPSTKTSGISIYSLTLFAETISNPNSRRLWRHWLGRILDKSVEANQPLVVLLQK